MKKLRIILLMFLSIFVFSTKFVLADEQTENLFAGAQFVVDEIKENNVLPYGVNHFRVLGKTSTSLSGYDADGLGGGTAKVEPGKLYEQQVNVMEIPSNENVKVTSWALLDGNKWTLATVRALIGDYEKKHPGWKVVGAINGDFFDIGANGNLPYQTSGAVASAGEFYKTTTGNLVGFSNNGSVNSLIGNKSAVRTPNMILSIYNDKDEIIKEFNIDKVNALPEEGESSVFYANYDSTKTIVPIEVTEAGYFVDKAELALPNNANDFYGKGTITSNQPKTISTGAFAIVSNNSEVKSYLDLNVKIRVQYKFIGDYENVNDITGGGTTIINNGEDSKVGLEDRAPRTVIGRKEDGTIIMMVIDGRQAHYGMYGADRTELAAIMNYYGAVEAYNLDGGGSSTMIIRRNGKFDVLNSPSDGNERTDANAVLIVVKDPEIEVKGEATTNSFNLDVDIKKLNNHDIKELYLTLNGETKKVENNNVNFQNLNSNTEYSYSISYKDSDNELTTIVTSGILKTYKLTPSYEGIIVFDRGDKFELLILYNDPDRAGNFDRAELKINGKLYGSFYNDLKTVTKANVAEIKSIGLTIFFNIGDGKNQKVVEEITGFTIEKCVESYMYDIFMIHNNFITNIIK